MAKHYNVHLSLSRGTLVSKMERISRVICLESLPQIVRLNISFFARNWNVTVSTTDESVRGIMARQETLPVDVGAGWFFHLFIKWRILSKNLPVPCKDTFSKQSIAFLQLHNAQSNSAKSHSTTVFLLTYLHHHVNLFSQGKYWKKVLLKISSYWKGSNIHSFSSIETTLETTVHKPSPRLK